MTERAEAHLASLRNAPHPVRERPFIPARYSELRSQAVEALRVALSAWAADDARRLTQAMCDGDRVLREIDALWLGK